MRHCPKVTDVSCPRTSKRRMTHLLLELVELQLRRARSPGQIFSKKNQRRLRYACPFHHRVYKVILTARMFPLCRTPWLSPPRRRHQKKQKIVKTNRGGNQPTKACHYTYCEKEVSTPSPPSIKRFQTFQLLDVLL